eukprot:jgi/Botrbrau1/14926/Bobra.0018s0030.1
MKADAVFVYDYCYLTWGQAETNGQGHELVKEHGYVPNPDVVKYLIKIYRNITQSARWKRDGGRTFVFWQPVAGMLTGPLWHRHIDMLERMMCEDLQRPSGWCRSCLSAEVRDLLAGADADRTAIQHGPHGPDAPAGRAHHLPPVQEHLPARALCGEARSAAICRCPF